MCFEVRDRRRIVLVFLFASSHNGQKYPCTVWTKSPSIVTFPSTDVCTKYNRLAWPKSPKYSDYFSIATPQNDQFHNKPHHYFHSKFAEYNPIHKTVPWANNKRL